MALGSCLREKWKMGVQIPIDARDREVDDRVWQLFTDPVDRFGPRPTLIEWDNDVPGWPALFAEVQCADEILLSAARSRMQSLR